MRIILPKLTKKPQTTAEGLCSANSTLSGNDATAYGGGAWYDYAGTRTITHSTIVENSAVYSGGGILPINGTLNLGHTIVADNTTSRTRANSDPWDPDVHQTASPPPRKVTIGPYHLRRGFWVIR